MGLARICPRFHKAIGACRETPLRLAKSRLTAVARLHSACASLSQPLRAASSPIGEPSGLLRIRLGYHEAIGACRETPLRLAKSRLTAVARLHGACASLSQPLRAASSPIGGAKETLLPGAHEGGLPTPSHFIYSIPVNSIHCNSFFRSPAFLRRKREYLGGADQIGKSFPCFLARGRI